MMRTRSTQGGFAAIAAIFLVVGLASLGAFMLTLSNTQQLTSAQDVQGTRAYWAARAGLEWGISSATAAAACPASPTTPVPTVLTVDGLRVEVTFCATLFTDGASIKLIQLRSVASSGTVGSVGYVERSLSASMER
jgi:MSHA biogenesis protein MshP